MVLLEITRLRTNYSAFRDNLGLFTVLEITWDYLRY